MHFLIFLTVGLVSGVLTLETSFRLARLLSDGPRDPALAAHAAAIGEPFDV